MRFLLTLILALGISVANADTTTNVLSGTNWTGVTNGNLPANRMPGSALLYDTATGTVNWSYSTATAAKTVAINNALSGSGIQVGGYNYTYDLRNMNGDNRQGSVDTMTVTMKMTSNTGATLLTNTNTHNTLFDWTTFSGTRSLTAPVSLSGLGNLSISFTSRDTGYWAGYFGPEVRNVGMSLNYSADQCASNPLSSTSCSGYAAAYMTQQCNANPLYDSSCPGYQTAMFSQQCSSNPLFATTCPGYATAVAAQQAAALAAQQAAFTAQCDANPLSDTACPGYNTAYATQQAAILAAQQAATQAAYLRQCTANPLSDSGCPGYATALAAQQAAILAAQQAATQAAFLAQCNSNQLSSVNCPGYASAYAAQQAAIQQASFLAQCTSNPLSSPNCSGYQAALNKKNATDAAIKQATPSVDTTSVAVTVATNTVSGISDPVVSSTVSTPTTTSPTSPTSVTSVISVLPQPPSTSTISAATAPAPATPAPSTETKQEAKKTETAIAKAVSKGVAAAAKEAAAKSANAKTLEDQAATQGLVVGLMGYVPGFSAYQNSIVPDTNALAMARQYSKANVDNRNAQRRLSGASDARWQEMVDSQYKIGE